MTLRVAVVAPDGEVWSGRARMVIAKTLDGDIGILTGHPPVLGLLADGSLVRVLDIEDGPEPDGGPSGGREAGGGPSGGREPGGGQVVAAVSSGFLAVADDRVSILAREAQLGSQVDTAATKAALDEAEPPPAGEPEPTGVKYSRALLRAAGERS
jgi:F-type H+-transporting ATPase subunit epsilon